MGNPVARVRDRVNCLVGNEENDPFFPAGKILKGSEDTFVDGRQVARVDDPTSNCCGGKKSEGEESESSGNTAENVCPNRITTGSESVFVNGRAIATNKSQVTRGKIVEYSLTTFVD